MEFDFKTQALAVSRVRRAVKKTLPSEAEIARIASLPGSTIRRQATNKLFRDARENLERELKGLLVTSMGAVLKKTILGHRKALNAAGVKLSPEFYSELSLRFMGDFLNKKFYGKTPYQRTKAVVSRTVNPLRTVVSKLRTGRLDRAGLKRILRNATSQEGSGLSANRSSKRLVVAEINRAQAHASIAIAREAKLKVQWTTTSAKPCSYCVARNGNIYAADDLEALNRHPMCRCYLRIIPNPVEAAAWSSADGPGGSPAKKVSKPRVVMTRPGAVAYSPATSIKEAEKQSKVFAKKADYKDFNLEDADIINATIMRDIEKHPIPKFDLVLSMQGIPGIIENNRPVGQFVVAHNDAIHLRFDDVAFRRTGKTSDVVLRKAPVAGTAGVASSYGETTREVKELIILHEIGHARVYAKMDRNLERHGNDKDPFLVKAAKVLPPISEYGKYTVHENIAEWYAVYRAGMVDRAYGKPASKAIIQFLEDLL